jgi:hypothetical protein
MNVEYVALSNNLNVEDFVAYAKTQDTVYEDPFTEQLMVSDCFVQDLLDGYFEANDGAEFVGDVMSVKNFNRFELRA